MIKLNLGCGQDIKEGYINIDCKKSPGVDKVLDLNKVPYPFKNSTIEEIQALSVLEHLDDVYALLHEWHRIAKTGAIIKISVPHFSSGDTWNDVQHRKGYGILAFEHKNLQHLFNIDKKKITFPKRRKWLESLANKYSGFYEYNLAYILPADTVEIIYKVKK